MTDREITTRARAVLTQLDHGDRDSLMLCGVVPWADGGARARSLGIIDERGKRTKLGLECARLLAAEIADEIDDVECWCDTDAMLVEGVAYEDGQVIPCPDCGYLWSVSCDRENPPHLIDCDLGFADEGHDHE